MKLYNTLHRKKEAFIPIADKKVRFYSCGPTVYNYAHIGNLRSYVFSDVLKRVLKYNGFDVNHVMNITDVGHLTSDADEGEDKMEKGAAREGKSVWDIAKYYTEAFMKDIHALNISDPDIWCKATDHIKEQIEQVQLIEKTGFTYQTSDGVYFDTSKLDDYGKLAMLKKDELQAGKRVDIGEKKNKTDFALWKFSPKDEQRQMEWESPWGVGFPGWHIECSAMASKYLGEQFDIHTGGIDHISVHHTNEIAQAETAFSKKPWVKYWLHGEFLVIDSGKMAKSGDNFLTLQTIMDKGYEALDYRYLCLSAHYRQQLKFSYKALDSAKASRARLMNVIEELRSEETSFGDITNYENEFLFAINDDLNMPQALAVLWNALRDKELGSKEKLELAGKFDLVLGLRVLEEVKQEIPDEIVVLAKKREQARVSKDWTQSDELRDAIKSKGYEILDGKEGYKIKKV